MGQCAYEMDYIYRTEIPEDYITITSGILGDQKPESILLVPLISNEALQGVLEFAFSEGAHSQTDHPVPAGTGRDHCPDPAEPEDEPAHAEVAGGVTNNDRGITKQ